VHVHVRVRVHETLIFCQAETRPCDPAIDHFVHVHGNVHVHEFMISTAMLLIF
jgi:hypothetical protein